MWRLWIGVTLLGLWIVACASLIAVNWHMAAKYGSQALGLRVVAARPLLVDLTIAKDDVELELAWTRAPLAGSPAGAQPAVKPPAQPAIDRINRVIGMQVKRALATGAAIGWDDLKHPPPPAAK